MPKKYRQGKKPSGKEVKPADTSCAGACQYNVKEDVVDKKRVKETAVFDKPKKGAIKKMKKKGKVTPDQSQ